MKFSFTFPLDIDGATVATFEVSVEVTPAVTPRCGQKIDTEDGWRYSDWTLEGLGDERDARGRFIRRDVAMPPGMVADVTEWLERPGSKQLDRLTGEFLEACSDMVESDAGREDAEREFCADVARECRT